MREVLYLTFINEEGKKRSITIDDPREDVSDLEVATTMDLIIAKDIFEPKLVSKDSARIVTTTVEDIEI